MFDVSSSSDRPITTQGLWVLSGPYTSGREVFTHDEPTSSSIIVFLQTSNFSDLSGKEGWRGFPPVYTNFVEKVSTSK